MAKKRFTDAEKFKDPWYLDLTLKEKVAWEYIISECDHAGIWKVNMKLLSFCIGEKFTKEDLKTSFARNIVVVDDEHVFIPKFLKFQYGKLSLKSNIHQNVIKRLKDIGITLNKETMSFDCPKGVSSLALPCVQAGPRVKEKEKDKDKVKEEYKLKEKEEIVSLEERKNSKKEIKNHIFDDVIQLFNETLPGNGQIQHYRIHSDTDRRNFVALVKSQPSFLDIGNWKELFELVKGRPKLLGTHSSFNVVANLGWLCIEKNIADVFNGKYERESGASSTRHESFEERQRRQEEYERSLRSAQ